MMGERWITFDLDGTLMQNPFVNWVFPEINKLVAGKTKGEFDAKKAMVTEHNRRMKQNKMVEAYDWDDILAKILRENAIDLDVEIEKLVIKHSIVPKIHLLEEDLLESLNSLRNNGYRLAVVTNGYAKFQLPVVEALKLKYYFDLFITPDQAGYAKPDERIVNKLMERGNVIAHVGDRIDHDVCLANKLNIASVFISRKLPSELINENPYHRNRHPLFKEFLQHKWESETNRPLTNDGKIQIPKMIIHSIRELSQIFSSEKPY